MKKVFLALAAFGLIVFTSCEKGERVEDVTENATEETAEAAQDTSETMENTENAVMDIPQFSNSDVQKFAQEYAAFYKEVQDVAKSGNQEKLDELQSQSVVWAQKAQEFTKKMSKEDMDKWIDWSQKIASAAQGK